MNHPTIALAMIVKNEAKNLPRLFESIRGCFDEIHITDTGSFDNTVEWLKENGAKIAGCPVHVHEFPWVNHFAKARNYSFSKCTADFVFWMDGDDCLHNREGFINWKTHAMPYADYFLAAYNYALDAEGKPVISFLRERVFRREKNPTWRYPIHEGIIPTPGMQGDIVPNTVWAVNHMRDAEDIKADKSRNIKILDELKAQGSEWDGRLQFYYGKELYEAGRPHEALKEFEIAVARKDLERHDMILACQYGSYAAQQCADQLKDEFRDEKKAYFDKGIEFAHQGLKLDQNRAEFYVALGDIYLKQGNLVSAVPNYGAAKSCFNSKAMGAPYEGAIYSFVDCYGLSPMLQLAKIYFHLGQIDLAEKEAKECVEKYQSDEAKVLLAEINKIKPLITIDNNQTENTDIVFTCPPAAQAYEFDEVLYQTKPMGGSETALIEMAKELKALTGRRVIVFNGREHDLVAPSGVEYISNKKVNEYFSKHKPAAHIAWRHNIKLTNAPTYLWAHDLQTPTTEAVQNFTKMLCLSEFHKEFTMGKKGISKDKIIVTRNGITPEKFVFDRPQKNPNKFVYMSSPDRGLYGAILTVDEVRKTYPDVTLDVYYGLGNLRKYGHIELADKIDALIKDRPWVKVHDFTEQKQMYREVSDAAVWIHPATFIETYCITAIEMLALGIYPVSRRFGALRDTLKAAEAKGQATLIDSLNISHYITEEEIKDYAKACCDAIEHKKWRNIDFDLNENSWHAIARSWVEFMGLKENEALKHAS